MTTLAELTADVARRLAPVHLASVAAAYRKEPAYSKEGAATVTRALPGPHKEVLAELHAAWAAQPETPGVALAIGLESAATTEAASDRTAVEVVVTGPNSPVAPVRLTSEVVRRLIDDAKHRVMLVSYAAYQVDSVIKALDRAVDERGVTVQLILESSENLDGGGGAHAYAKYVVYEWPPADRVPHEAKLHAKAVIVDGRDVLLTSANMTNAAYSKNIELGVLCRGGNTARHVQEHFDGLISTGVLQAVP
ncbi:MAG: hypothetical protein JJLCMIEE_03572 [Acidimicrobiales bacterium]|nr:MAG: hypothetical protein EDR02_16040 [Actinomycetota bacterium]MBV6510425.1 hypothetical protein [Acidimicrobiales bacterium]RIK03769.1 MAG: hypothetical protein DCC48_15700 [Acidobacteriota bacterium]